MSVDWLCNINDNNDKDDNDDDDNDDDNNDDDSNDDYDNDDDDNNDDNNDDNDDNDVSLYGRWWSDVSIQISVTIYHSIQIMDSHCPPTFYHLVLITTISQFCRLAEKKTFILWLIICIYYQSRITCPLFFEKLRWSDDKSITPHGPTPY